MGAMHLITISASFLMMTWTSDICLRADLFYLISRVRMGRFFLCPLYFARRARDRVLAFVGIR